MTHFLNSRSIKDKIIILIISSFLFLIILSTWIIVKNDRIINTTENKAEQAEATIKTNANILSVNKSLINEDEEISASLLLKDLNTEIFILTFLGAASLLFIGVKTIKDQNRISQEPVDLLEKISKGELIEKQNNSEIENNVLFNVSLKISDNLKSASSFALEIGNGNFDNSFQPLSNKDELGNALVQMKEKLQHVADEDRKSNWITNGYAKLAEILRKEGIEENDMYDEIIGFIVKYVNANQGALFVHNTDTKKIDMVACYAYGRKKYIESSVEAGQGLIGQVYLERSYTLLKEVPQNFVKITSGLGEATPSCVFACPMIVNEECYGVFELASFEVLEDYQIEFLEQIGEQIGTTISRIAINRKTSDLLQASQQNEEELRAQEEELRQNMEELQATQEEMQRKDVEITGQLNAINNTMATIEFTPDGIIKSANDKFLSLMQYSLDEIQDRHHKIFVNPQEAAGVEYASFWKDLKAGMSKTGEFRRFAKDGSIVWLSASYTPVLSKSGEVQKIIKLALNISEQKMLSLDHKGKMSAIDNTLASIEFDLHGNIKYANLNFLEAMGYSIDEVKDKHHRMFVDFDDINEDAYLEFWEELRHGRHQSGEFRRIGKNGKIVWINASYTPIKDDTGKVIKIIKFASDITEKKLQSLDVQSQLAAINRSTAVIEFDMEGIILKANDIFASAMGYEKPEDFIGQHHKIFVPKDHIHSNEYKEFWNRLQKGEFFKGRFDRVKANGTDVLIEGSYNPILDARGEPYKVVKYAQVLQKEARLSA